MMFKNAAKDLNMLRKQHTERITNPQSLVSITRAPSDRDISGVPIDYNN